jgi:serine/threonine protein kinase
LRPFIPVGSSPYSGLLVFDFLRSCPPRVAGRDNNFGRPGKLAICQPVFWRNTMTTNLTGQSIGRYHILEQLGEGGMATVYKAFDTRLETDVAVKVIRTEALPQNAVERALKRFEREAKALARLTHPNIIPVIDYGEHSGHPYLVMKYLPGGTLKQTLRGKPIPWQKALKMLVPIAQGLDYAHRQGMVHRDVKPANILITADGAPMLSDFGIAKIIDEEITMDLTGTSATVGTPEYMAPEQVTSKTVDHRADIYALGVVLYEMITGRKPYQADTPMAVMFKHASEPLPNPRLFVPDIPESVEKVLLKALAKKPEDRYQDASMMAIALEEILANFGALVRGSDQSKKKSTNDTLATIEQDDTYSTHMQETTFADSRTPLETTKLESIPASNKRWLPWILILGGIGLVALILVTVMAVVIMLSNRAMSENTTSSAEAIQQPATPVLAIPTKQSSPMPSPTLKPTSLPSATAEPAPRMYEFEVCLQPCNGSNAIRSFPATTTKIYVRWKYSNIPANVKYVRVWTQSGREWVRYECNWPNASSGIEEITLTEPGGLHSGTWIIKVYIDGQLLLNESIFVEGNSTYWDPAGTFNSCYGKR